MLQVFAKFLEELKKTYPENFPIVAKQEILDTCAQIKQTADTNTAFTELSTALATKLSYTKPTEQNNIYFLLANCEEYLPEDRISILAEALSETFVHEANPLFLLKPLSSVEFVAILVVLFQKGMTTEQIFASQLLDNFFNFNVFAIHIIEEAYQLLDKYILPSLSYYPESQKLIKMASVTRCPSSVLTLRIFTRHCLNGTILPASSEFQENSSLATTQVAPMPAPSFLLDPQEKNLKLLWQFFRLDFLIPALKLIPPDGSEPTFGLLRSLAKKLSNNDFSVLYEWLSNIDGEKENRAQLFTLFWDLIEETENIANRFYNGVIFFFLPFIEFSAPLSEEQIKIIAEETPINKQNLEFVFITLVQYLQYQPQIGPYLDKLANRILEAAVANSTTLNLHTKSWMIFLKEVYLNLGLNDQWNHWVNGKLNEVMLSVTTCLTKKKKKRNAVFDVEKFQEIEDIFAKNQSYQVLVCLDPVNPLSSPAKINVFIVKQLFDPNQEVNQNDLLIWLKVLCYKISPEHSNYDKDQFRRAQYTALCEIFNIVIKEEYAKQNDASEKFQQTQAQQILQLTANVPDKERSEKRQRWQYLTDFIKKLQENIFAPFSPLFKKIISLLSQDFFAELSLDIATKRMVDAVLLDVEYQLLINFIERHLNPLCPKNYLKIEQFFLEKKALYQKITAENFNTPGANNRLPGCKLELFTLVLACHTKQTKTVPTVTEEIDNFAQLNSVVKATGIYKEDIFQQENSRQLSLLVPIYHDFYYQFPVVLIQRTLAQERYREAIYFLDDLSPALRKKLFIRGSNGIDHRICVELNKILYPVHLTFHATYNDQYGWGVSNYLQENKRLCQSKAFQFLEKYFPENQNFLELKINFSALEILAEKEPGLGTKDLSQEKLKALCQFITEFSGNEQKDMAHYLFNFVQVLENINSFWSNGLIIFFLYFDWKSSGVLYKRILELNLVQRFVEVPLDQYNLSHLLSILISNAFDDYLEALSNNIFNFLLTDLTILKKEDQHKLYRAYQFRHQEYPWDTWIEKKLTPLKQKIIIELKKGLFDAKRFAAIIAIIVTDQPYQVVQKLAPDNSFSSQAKINTFIIKSLFDLNPDFDLLTCAQVLSDSATVVAHTSEESFSEAQFSVICHAFDASYNPISYAPTKLYLKIARLMDQHFLPVLITQKKQHDIYSKFIKIEYKLLQEFIKPRMADLSLQRYQEIEGFFDEKCNYYRKLNKQVFYSNGFTELPDCKLQLLVLVAKNYLSDSSMESKLRANALYIFLSTIQLFKESDCYNYFYNVFVADLNKCPLSYNQLAIILLEGFFETSGFLRLMGLLEGASPNYLAFIKKSPSIDRHLKALEISLKKEVEKPNEQSLGTLTDLEKIKCYLDNDQRFRVLKKISPGIDVTLRCAYYDALKQLIQKNPQIDLKACACIILVDPPARAENLSERLYVEWLTTIFDIYWKDFYAATLVHKVATLLIDQFSGSIPDITFVKFSKESTYLAAVSNYLQQPSKEHKEKLERAIEEETIKRHTAEPIINFYRHHSIYLKNELDEFISPSGFLVSFSSKKYTQIQAFYDQKKILYQIYRDFRFSNTNYGYLPQNKAELLDLVFYLLYIDIAFSANPSQRYGSIYINHEYLHLCESFFKATGLWPTASFTISAIEPGPNYSFSKTFMINMLMTGQLDPLDYFSDSPQLILNCIHEIKNRLLSKPKIFLKIWNVNSQYQEKLGGIASFEVFLQQKHRNKAAFRKLLYSEEFKKVIQDHETLTVILKYVKKQDIPYLFSLLPKITHLNLSQVTGNNLPEFYRRLPETLVSVELPDSCLLASRTATIKEINKIPKTVAIVIFKKDYEKIFTDLDDILDVFHKIKQEFSKKASNNTQADAIQQLISSCETAYHELKEQTKKNVSQQEIVCKLRSCAEAWQTAITNADPVLKIHRGWAELIRKVKGVLASIFSLGLVNLYTGKNPFTLFSLPKTDAHQKIEAAHKRVNQLIERLPTVPRPA